MYTKTSAAATQQESRTGETRAASHYVCQEEQLNYPGVCWVRHWHIKTIGFASGAQTHIIHKCPSVYVVKALKSEGQDIHRMNYWCEQSDHWCPQIHAHRQATAPQNTLVVENYVKSDYVKSCLLLTIITLKAGNVMNNLLLWWCDRWVQVKRVTHTDVWIIASTYQLWRILRGTSYDGHPSPRWQLSGSDVSPTVDPVQ